MAIAGAMALTSAAGPAAGRVAAAPVAAIDARAVMTQYCVTCHNQKSKTGGLALDDLDPAKAPEHAEVFEKVVRKIRAGVMPPSGARRPEPAVLTALAAAIESSIDQAAAKHPNPGRTEALHRLNRTEYRNAVRDVLGLEVDVAQLLPADDASYGFDNIAGVLKLNQSNMERYLTAAMRVSRAAVGTLPSSPAVSIFPVPVDQPQYDRVEGLPFGTRGGTLINYQFPSDGEYEITITLNCTTEGDLECNGSMGWSQQHELQALVDNAVVQTWTLKPKAINLTFPNNDTSEGPVDKDERWKVRIPVTAGRHTVGVTFVQGPDVEFVRAGYRKRFERPYRYYADTVFIAMPFVDKVQIAGPFQIAGAGDTPSRRAVFTCRPATAAGETACATQILSRLARRAYRRPVTPADVTDLLAFYDAGRKEGGFEHGIEIAIRRMLVSTSFLFRRESDPATVTAGAAYRISDLELASRLSFFLWSTVPDDQLLDAAAGGRLSRPAVLRQQVRRMLADPKASALVENFFGQWLRLRHVESHRPSEFLFPDFDGSLRVAFRRETEAFVDYIIRQDRSALDLLEADYTFVNERLARHYGIPNVQGVHFRKVTYPDDRRRGILGHGSVLMLTSHAARTSPVMRGKWVLENILAVAPPPPPPDVPQLPEEEAGSRKTQTMREKMATHRRNPVCASCHSMIDPAGFALENFDPVARWRDVDDSFKPLDTTGVLPDGTSFRTLGDFRAALKGQRGRFLTNVTEKLLIYALGRGTEAYDQPTIRKIVAEAASSDYRFSSLVMGIVTSVPFQMRRAEAAPAMARR
ncbi:MAG: DUF1592 domain-containing protein [Alphaproteobacteria bacterium]